MYDPAAVSNGEQARRSYRSGSHREAPAANPTRLPRSGLVQSGLSRRGRWPPLVLESHKPAPAKSRYPPPPLARASSNGRSHAHPAGSAPEIVRAAPEKPATRVAATTFEICCSTAPTALAPMPRAFRPRKLTRFSALLTAPYTSVLVAPRGSLVASARKRNVSRN